MVVLKVTEVVAQVPYFILVQQLKYKGKKFILVTKHKVRGKI